MHLPFTEVAVAIGTKQATKPLSGATVGSDSEQGTFIEVAVASCTELVVFTKEEKIHIDRQPGQQLESEPTIYGNPY